VSKTFSLDWKGGQVVKLCEEQLKAIMADAGLEAEAEAKKELRKGHGVVTGTLRRSIHTANPGYDFAADNVEPGAGTPERGGNKAEAEKIEGKVTVALGSGLSYAMRIHQGWGSFKGYHYLMIGVEKMKPKLGQIIKRHQVK
jgi:hypothetical protein